MRKINNLLILAGGDSTRFSPLSEKNFMKFLGQELILHQIKDLMPYAQKIFVVSNKENYGKMRELTQTLGQHIEILIQDNALVGQAGAILSAKNAIQGEVLVMNANDFFNPNVFTDLVEEINKKKPQALFLTKEVTSYFPGGYVQFDGDRVCNIIEKPTPDKTPSNIIKLVVDYFSDFGKLICAIEEISTRADDWYETSLNSLIKKTKGVKHFLYEDYWYSLKYPWHVLPLLEFYLKKITKNTIDPTAAISSRVEIIPPVLIKKGVRIGDFSKVVGPCYIDENTIIGDHVLLRESHIGRNAVIGGNCEIARSYIADNVMLHRNYVGDSVLDTGTSFGAGAVTANYRFDEEEVSSMVNHKKVNTHLKKFGSIIGKDSKIGINASIFPGVKIGVNTFVSPGSAVREDIGDDCFVDGSIKKNNIVKY